VLNNRRCDLPAAEPALMKSERAREATVRRFSSANTVEGYRRRR
jgi:hypothetical protein